MCTRPSFPRSVSPLTWGSIPRAFRGVLLGVLALNACGGEPNTTAPDTVPVFTSVAVTPESSTLVTAGETVQLEAAALDQSNNQIPGKTFTWTSSDEDVATVGSTGLVTAAGANGSVTITAASEGKSGSATVEVVTGPQGGTVSVAGGQVTLQFPAGALGQPTTVTVEPVAAPPAAETLVPETAFEFGPDGTQFNELVQLTIGYDVAKLPPDVPETELRLHKLVEGEWEEVAGSSVDADTQQVTGAIDSFSIYACLGRRVVSVEVTPSAASLAVGATVQLTATLRDRRGNVLSGRPITWSSDNESVATVDETGLVTAVAAGDVTIAATSQDMKSGSAAIMVSETPVASVGVEPSEATIVRGGTVQLTAEPRDAAGNGTVQLVSGSLSERAFTGPNSNRGWIRLNLSEDPPPTVPAMSNLGLAALSASLLAVGLFVALRRQRANTAGA